MSNCTSAPSVEQDVNAVNSVQQFHTLRSRVRVGPQVLFAVLEGRTDDPQTPAAHDGLTVNVHCDLKFWNFGIQI